jgi:ribosomal protein S12 methylthiotransferase accessory factor
VARLLLSPKATVIATPAAVLVRSDFLTVRLRGRDLADLVGSVLPLLDGTRDRDEVADALPLYSRSSVVALIDGLTARGMIESVGQGGGSPSPYDDWLRSTAIGEEALERLARSRVAIVGSMPWGGIVAAELTTVGVGCVLLPPGPLALPRGTWDLLIGATVADDLALLYALATEASERGVRSLTGYLEGATLVIGPAVTPGKTACWNCFRLRQLANDPHSSDARAWHRSLLEAAGSLRQRATPPAMEQLLGHLLVLEALKLLSGGGPALHGRVLTHDLLSHEQEIHAVVPMPRCEACGGAERMVGGALPQKSASASVDLGAIDDPHELELALAGWVDRRVGIIRRVTVSGHVDGVVELPITAGAAVGSYTEGAGPLAGGGDGFGDGLTRAEAMLGAVGEAIERYSAARCSKAGLCHATMRSMAGAVLAPPWLGLYEGWQYDTPGFPYVPFDPEQPIDWIAGTWLHDGAPVWVPAFPTYLEHAVPPPERFCQVTSNGLAAGADLSDATRRATLELLERDAFMLTWHARLPARRVDLSGLGSDLGAVARAWERSGAEIELYHLDVGHSVPVIMAVMYGDGERLPGATVGMGADLDGRIAVRRALLELGHNGKYVCRLMHGLERRIPAVPAEVQTFDDHALYYAPRRRSSAFEFLRSDPRPSLSIGDLRHAEGPPLEDLRGRLALAGLEVAIADVTAPDVALGPFRVARALGVNLAQLEFGFGLRRLANPRLQRFLADRPVNPEPHPMD